MRIAIIRLEVPTPAVGHRAARPALLDSMPSRETFGGTGIITRRARCSLLDADRQLSFEVGSYSYPHEIFPLGGRRGEQVEVSFGQEKIKLDLQNIRSNERQASVNVPGSPALPVPFAIGDDPELNEPPVDEPIGVPVTINGRVGKAGEVDRYTIRVPAGRAMTFRIQARELGTSKLMAVITARDEQGNLLGRSGDEPLAEDLFNVNQSRTAGDPVLRVQTPEGVKRVTLTVEDLALRGGPNYAYRLNVQPVGQDFRLILSSAFVNVPAEGRRRAVTVQLQGLRRRAVARRSALPDGEWKVDTGGGAAVKRRRSQSRSLVLHRIGCHL